MRQPATLTVGGGYRPPTTKLGMRMTQPPSGDAQPPDGQPEQTAAGESATGTAGQPLPPPPWRPPDPAAEQTATQPAVQPATPPSPPPFPAPPAQPPFAAPPAAPAQAPSPFAAAAPGQPFPAPGSGQPGTFGPGASSAFGPPPGSAPPGSAPPGTGAAGEAPAGKRRGLLIASLVLAVVLVLCGGGGIAAFLVINNLETGGGAAEPVAAVDEFLQAVYTDRDVTAAADLVCREARDETALIEKVEEIEGYSSTYRNPEFEWNVPAVDEQAEDRAVVTVTVQMITEDERSAEQELSFVVVRRSSWFVCDVS
ncbi:hypothetical protein [Micromonospora sp. LOL_023]|uniref:Rv0361 family membrane protein n=1 Tax=Micromonospora sp. LOL_023 TaxID=3345418 RepID=UPI003A870BED